MSELSGMTEIDLVRDVLDNQLVDRTKRKMGKVDGIILEVRKGEPPRIAFIEVGGPTLAARLHPKIGELVSALAKRAGPGGESYRIPWNKVRDIGIDVKVGLVADNTSVLDFEHWLQHHVIERIPGGK